MRNKALTLRHNTSKFVIGAGVYSPQVSLCLGVTVGFWPFASRGGRKPLVDALAPPMSIDFAAFAVNDAVVKLWLPEKLAAALDALSANTQASRPDVLRRLLFEHVYGRVLFEQLAAWKIQQEQKPKPPFDPSADLTPRFSPARGASIAHLGKSTEDFKLWLPSSLKQSLEDLAEKDCLGLSDYIRKVLVRLLLGEQAYAEWQDLGRCGGTK